MHFINRVYSLGCNRKKYELRSRVLKVNNDKKVKDVATQLKEAKDRRQQLQQDDPQQAQSLYKSMFCYSIGCIYAQLFAF